MTVRDRILEYWRKSPDISFTSRQIGALLLRDGHIGIDACRGQAIDARARMPRAGVDRLIEYGAQNIAASHLGILRKRGLVSASAGRPAYYRLTDVGRSNLAAEAARVASELEGI